MSISSLFISQYGTTAGYAFDAYESMLFRLGLNLAGGDQSRVHFAYPNVHRGRPNKLPEDFQNIAVLDINKTNSPAELHQFEQYVRKHKIDLALAIDLDVEHPAVRFLRKGGVRCVISYYGCPICNVSPSWKVLAKRAKLALSASKVDSLIFESIAMADLAVRWRGVKESMVEVVYIGVDTTKYRPLAPADNAFYVHDHFGFDRTAKVFVYAGHMEPRKGIGVIIDAAIKLISERGDLETCFLFCGDRPNESNVYKDRYNHLDLENRIVFGGYRNDLPEVYRSCFGGIIASTGWDSFPQSAVEMSSSGLPIIASRLGGLPEAVLENQTGLIVPPGNSDALSDSITRLTSDPDFAKNLGLSGHARCVTELNCQSHDSRLLERCRNILWKTGW